MLKPKIIITTFESLTANSAGGVGKISYGLATHLHQKGYPVLFVTINKGPHQTAFPSTAVHWSSRYFLYALNLVSKFGLVSRVKQRRIEEQYFDFFLNRMNLKGDYLVSTSAFIPKTLRSLKGFQKKTFIPPTPNEIVINELCQAELTQKKVAGKSYTDPYIDKVRLTAFRNSIGQFDEILSISPVTTASYAGPYPPVLEIPFVNFPLKTKPIATTAPQEKPKLIFMYVGHSVLLKGVHRLLEEWKQAALPNAELHIVGQMEVQYQEAFDINLSKYNNVKLFGYVDDLEAAYLGADVIVIPSLIDNEPQTAIEALSLGKPILISQNCGYARLVNQYVPQAVFNILESGALSQKLQLAAQDIRAFTAPYAAIVDYIRTGKFDYKEFFANIAQSILPVEMALKDR